VRRVLRESARPSSAPLHLSGPDWDQQIPLERTFAAPYELVARLGRPLDVAEHAADYANHCELGGHPTPQGRNLLANPSGSGLDPLCWTELAVHSSSVWNYIVEAVREYDTDYVADLDQSAIAPGFIFALRTRIRQRAEPVARTGGRL